LKSGSPTGAAFRFSSLSFGKVGAVPAEVFGVARLRAYRVLEDAGVSTALQLQILDRVLAGLLWLPVSLVEIGFRNAADRAIARAHPARDDWFLEAGRGGPHLIAANVLGPASFRVKRYDGTLDDPIAEAAQMAARQLGNIRVSRDDVIAHLMLGFWVGRCPESLLIGSKLEYWELVAHEFGPPLNDSHILKSTLSKLALTRNRIAHHEPLLFRRKNIFRGDDPMRDAELIVSLENALAAFRREVELVTSTARVIVPMAATDIDPIGHQVEVAVEPLKAAIAAERERFRKARQARVEARAASRASRLLGDAP
jgi:hypothetical protein